MIPSEYLNHYHWENIGQPTCQCFPKETDHQKCESGTHFNDELYFLFLTGNSIYPHFSSFLLSIGILDLYTPAGCIRCFW